MSPQTTAFLLATAAALATLLGWAAVAAKRTWTPRGTGIMLFIAAGVMVIVSAGELIPTALATSSEPRSVVLCVVVGGLFVIGVRWISDRIFPSVSRAASSAAMVAVAISVHNIPEGSATVAATVISVQAGVITAIAIGLHNIPEGIAVSSIVIAAGGTRMRALFFTMVATAGEIMGVLIILSFEDVLTEDRMSGLLAAVAGVMIALSFTEIGPAALREIRRGQGGPVAPGDSHNAHA
jgi:ZIP family zinc transporter